MAVAAHRCMPTRRRAHRRSCRLTFSASLLGLTTVPHQRRPHEGAPVRCTSGLATWLSTFARCAAGHPVRDPALFERFPVQLVAEVNLVGDPCPFLVEHCHPPRSRYFVGELPQDVEALLVRNPFTVRLLDSARHGSASDHSRVYRRPTIAVIGSGENLKRVDRLHRRQIRIYPSSRACRLAT